MRRQRTDNDQWFDIDAAEAFKESRSFDGRNMISDATGSQWEHETLYRTRGGRWVLHHWSQWQGSRPSWARIDNDEAAQWLIRNGHEAHHACQAEYDAREIL